MLRLYTSLAAVCHFLFQIRRFNNKTTDAFLSLIIKTKKKKSEKNTKEGNKETIIRTL